MEGKKCETAQSCGFDQKLSAIERAVQSLFAVDLLIASPVFIPDLD